MATRSLWDLAGTATIQIDFYAVAYAGDNDGADEFVVACPHASITTVMLSLRSAQAQRL